MKYIKPYVSDEQLHSIINSELAPISESIAISLDYNSFEKEVLDLNRIESLINEDTLLNLQFDMIVNEGLGAITKYYRGLANNTNDLIDRVKKGLTIEEREVLETKYRELLSKSKARRLNEQLTIPTDILKGSPEGDYTKALTQAATQDDVLAGEESGGIMSTIKSLWNAITEDGSPIGILHLVLDILGLFGDAFMIVGLPIGLVADLLNGIIYLMRGKTILAVISFIAAIIPMAGDSLKLFKPAAKGMDAVLTASVGSAKITEPAYSTLMKMNTKDRFGVMRGLSYISKSLGGVMGKVVEILGKFFDSFLAKVSSYIPLIGGPLSRFFSRIGSKIKTFADDMLAFSKEWPAVEQKAVQKSIDDFFKGTETALEKGGKITVEGDTLIVKAGNGKVMQTMPVKELTNSKVILQKYPEGPLAEYFKSGGGEKIAKFYTTLAEVNFKADKTILKKAWKIGKTVIRLKTSVILFVAKQITKVLYYSSGDMMPSDAEANANAVVALDNFLQDRCNKEMKNNPDQIYCTPLLNTGEVTDYEAIKALTDYQNHYAESFGLPSIIHVAYVQGKDEMPDDVKEFFNQTFTESEIKEMNTLANEYGFNKENKFDKTEESLSHIISFNKFKK